MSKKKTAATSSVSPTQEPMPTPNGVSKWSISASKEYVAGIKPLLISAVDDKSKLTAAIQWWRFFPLYLDVLVDEFSKEIGHNGELRNDAWAVEADLFECHKFAVDVLIRAAENMMLNSRPLRDAGNYCRWLMLGPRRADFVRISETAVRPSSSELWPACFRPSIFGLQEDVRTSIMAANDIVDDLEKLPVSPNSDNTNHQSPQNSKGARSDRDNDPKWTDWLPVKRLKRHFGFGSKSGWTDFAKKRQIDGLLEIRPNSGYRVARIAHKLFNDRGVPIIPRGS